MRPLDAVLSLSENRNRQGYIGAYLSLRGYLSYTHLT